jgi:hypothetical protein
MMGGAIGDKLEHAFSNENTVEFAALAERPQQPEGKENCRRTVSDYTFSGHYGKGRNRPRHLASHRQSP